MVAPSSPAEQLCLAGSLNGIIRPPPAAAEQCCCRTGILNGIDDHEWNPQTDPHLPENYTAHDFVHGKAANKAALQRELGLPERPDVSALRFDSAYIHTYGCQSL